MAKKRKTDKFYPLQRKDVDSLFASSPPPEPMQYDFGRQNHFVHPTKPSKTILRWFRVLIDSEASGASASGDIPEEDLDNNNMTRREDTVCVTQTQATEPEPSMWGVELTRYNCEVRYRQRREAYELIRFPAVKSDADLAAIGDDLKDERVLCWWNSNSGHWEAITGEGGVEEPASPAISCCMEFVQVCSTESNDCCLLEGVRWHIDATETESFCNPNKCFVPVWLWCMQGVAPNAEVDIASSLMCQFGRLLKSAHSCNGDIRDVFGIDCGSCDLPCPGEEVKVSIVTPIECITGVHEFTAKCVMEDPIRKLGDPGWWGEFELTGSYPQIGIAIDVEPFLVGGDAVDVVYAVIGCQSNNLCETDKYYIDRGAGYEVYSGTFETTTNPATVVADPVPITDENGCVLQCTRTYRYGVFFRCDPLSGGLFDGKIYRLHRGSMASAGTLDPCMTPGTIVPLPEDSINGAGDNIAFDPRGCEPLQDGDLDWNVSTSGESCDIDLLNAVPPAILSGMAPFLYETFGGCESWQQLIEVSIGVPIPSCVDPPGTELITLRFDWSGTDQCKEQ